MTAAERPLVEYLFPLAVPVPASCLNHERRFGKPRDGRTRYKICVTSTPPNLVRCPVAQLRLIDNRGPSMASGTGARNSIRCRSVLSESDVCHSHLREALAKEQKTITDSSSPSLPPVNQQSTSSPLPGRFVPDPAAMRRKFNGMNDMQNMNAREIRGIHARVRLFGSWMTCNSTLPRRRRIPASLAQNETRLST